ncbi:MAG: hypothetical protein ABI193_21745, partial [Minicystis sp.]
MKRFSSRILGALASVAFLGAGCGDNGSTGTSGTGAGGAAPSGGSIVFTASGEVLVLGGYDFPFTEVGFVDGWEVKFTELLVTVDKITLSENPDLDPGDESKTGALVAQVDGPWAIDLHKGGPLQGKGGSEEQAVEIATIDKQNKNGDKPFEGDSRYAFGFDIVPASAQAKLLNLDEKGKADYAEMQQKGYTVLYVGTATFKGTSCAPADPEFDKLPKVVNFRLGFKTPTTMINCQNPDNDPAKPFGAEEHQRGIVTKANQAVTAQVTVHTDHPFWDSFAHDVPPHFDQIAARYVGVSGTPTALVEDMVGVDPTGFTDNEGNKLPWRSCTQLYTPPDMGTMHFDPHGVPLDPAGDPSKALRDYADFMTYGASTMGHLNSDGLCFTRRNYPS